MLDYLGRETTFGSSQLERVSKIEGSRKRDFIALNLLKPISAGDRFLKKKKHLFIPYTKLSNCF